MVVYRKSLGVLNMCSFLVIEPRLLLGDKTFSGACFSTLVANLSSALSDFMWEHATTSLHFQVNGLYL